MQALHFVLDI